ncbi:hypothetical protein P7K49_023515 [Saguinus oedipus]|uniref:NACHT domain-containing protein n=1 Tax=Saguinus oedipus TaxID=9490 RepID=A0ABQ9UMN8_SAGOE|nr:hypothetical protein P7K49_023515 [Saguinus oedipus]
MNLPELSKTAKFVLLKDRQVEDSDNPELRDSEEVLELAKPREKEGWRNVMDEQSLQTTQLSPYTVGLQRPADVGKTMLAKKCMLDWKDYKLGLKARYAFYLSCKKLSHLGPCSFAELIVKDRPELQDDIPNILAQAQRILFVVDGLDELRVPPRALIQDIRRDWKKLKLVPVLLGSLLKRKMLPKAALLVTTRPRSLKDMQLLAEKSIYLRVEAFLEEDRRAYFLRYFGEEDQAMHACGLMRSNAALFQLGSAPAVCQIMCTSLKLQIEKGEGTAPPPPATPAWAVPALSLQPLPARCTALERAAGAEPPGCAGPVGTDVRVPKRGPGEVRGAGVGKDQKKHRKKNSGPKAEKKNKQHLQDLQLEDEDDNRKKNPKAFAVHSTVQVALSFHRTQDLKTKKHPIPVVDGTPLEPPPIVVVVMGPPKVGRSTLIQRLSWNFTQQKLTEIRGSVMIVSGKKCRLAIIECGCDINMMIDLAKVADLTTIHHNDAKLFYLSGVVHGEYQNQEIHNLGCFITVTKCRPRTWKTSHSYILANSFVNDMLSRQEYGKLEELEIDSEADLPAFADSEDDLEGSSAEEGEAEEADESSEEEDCSAGERGISGSKPVGEGSKAELSPANPRSDLVNLEKSLLMKEAALTTSDSGHCTAEEAFASEDESEEISLSAEEEDLENEDAFRKKLSKPSQVGSGQKLGSGNN